METQAIIFMIIGLGIPYTLLTLALRKQFTHDKKVQENQELPE